MELVPLHWTPDLYICTDTKLVDMNTEGIVNSNSMPANNVNKIPWICTFHFQLQSVDGGITK